MNRYVVLNLIALSLAGCSIVPPRLPDTPSVFSQETLTQGKTAAPEDKEAKARLALRDRLPQAAEDSPVTTRKFFTFRARNLPVEQAMAQFAQTYGLNVAVDADVKAVLTADFRNLSLDKTLEAMLEPIGLSWEWNEGLLRVTRQQTKTFTIDYLRLVRAGSANSTTSTSSSGGSSTDTTKVGVTRSDSINFWDEVEKQIGDILTMGRDDYAGAGEQAPQETTTFTDRATNTTTTSSRLVREKAGRLIVNRLAGTVQVTTTAARMRAIEGYLESLRQNVLRQVYIDVKIVEVDLSGDNALGVDWSKVDMGALVLGTSTAFTTSAAGTTLSTPTGKANYDKSFIPTHLVKSLSAVVSALQQQGNVRVVSQPRIRTLNNQPAIVKAGTERTFYTTTTTVTTTNGAAIVNTTNTPTTVTEGVVLSVTPQISADDRIALDVSPVVTRVSGVDTSNDGNSSAPRLDVKQTSTMVRVGDGETIIIGGLIQESEEETRRSVPGLGSTPAIGTLFSSNYSAKIRRELVIILTPYIVR
jgi:MSHA type pilus biogenesis protein MshL